jgi:nitroreductase
MSDALDLLKSRRSSKPADLGAPGPSRLALDTMLTIASRVPDHGKLVPWRFIVFEGEGRLAAGEHIGAAFRADHPDANLDDLNVERTRLARAPIVVAVVSRATLHVSIPQWEQVLSGGAVAMNLVLAAHALGFAAAWITEWYAFDRRVLDAFGLKPHERIVGFVHVGTPRRACADRPRPRLEDIVTRFNP